MLTLKTQIFLLVVSILAMFFLTTKIKKGRLKLKYALSWYVVVFIIFVLAAFPRLIDAIARLVGIADPVNMLFLFGMIFLLILLYKLTSAVSRLSDKVKKLTQEIAILEKRTKEEND